MTLNDTASLRAVQSFARGHGKEEAAAVKIYEEEITSLDQRARVKKFVPLLAEKHTKDRLRAS